MPAPNGRKSEWIKFLGSVASLILTVLLIPVVIWGMDMTAKVRVLDRTCLTIHDVPPPQVITDIEHLEYGQVEIKQELRHQRSLLESHISLHDSSRSQGSIRPDIMPPGGDD